MRFFQLEKKETFLRTPCTRPNFRNDIEPSTHVPLFLESSDYKLSKKYGFKIIEDASHAIGGSYNCTKIGSCRFSDITVFSFHPVKIITTAEGGCATTNNTEIFENLKLFSSHGVTRDPKKMVIKTDEPWIYDQISIGLNYRMSDLNAALGLSQIPVSYTHLTLPTKA